MHQPPLVVRPAIFALSLTLLTLTAGCNKGAKLIERATEQEAAGDLDEALETLAQVKTEAPATPEVDEAKALAVGWLIETAEQEGKPEGKQKRLEAALEWDPTSGKAQVRLCALHLDGKELAELRDCLGAGLAKTTGAPKAEVERLRAGLKAMEEAAGELDGPSDGKAPAPLASAAPLASGGPAPSWQAKTRIRRTDGATMVLVPAGFFVRGSAANEGEDDEHPQQRITLETFWIDKLEVTVGQYKKCVEDKGCAAPAWGENCSYAAKDRDDHPINCVIWKEAVDYCTWAGARLPTEAEWEKAARGPDGRKYPWGDAPPSCSLAILPESGTRGCGKNMTWPVGSKPDGASIYGALDMAGNVWEWCSDYYDETYYSRSPTTDPTGPDSGSPRVNRGGGWEAHDTLHLRGANRYKFAPSFRFHALGMRCAASVD